MKAVVAAFNQEKALVEAFSVITNLRMDLFEALHTGGASQASSHKWILTDLLVCSEGSHESLNFAQNWRARG